MAFFPFGIPSTSSFAEKAQRATNLYTPSYSAEHAKVARKAPPGSPAADATHTGCPDGYTSAILPTPPYAPVPSNPNVNRDGYILCFQLPPNPSPNPTPTITPSITPSAPAEVCDVSSIAVATGVTCDTPVVNQTETLHVSSYNRYYTSPDCTSPATGDYFRTGSPSPGYYSCGDGDCIYISCAPTPLPIPSPTPGALLE